MKIIYIFVVFISACEGEVEDAAPWNLIPENMETFCQSENVCRRPNLPKKPPMDLPVDFINCCTECSCEQTCGKNESCCFATLNKYRNPSRPNQDCLPALIGKTGEMETTYYMVTDSTKGKLKYLLGDNTTAVPCGDVNVTSLGSMVPVFSKRTGLIYKNAICAKLEEGDREMVPWIPNFYCLRRGLITTRSYSIAQYAYDIFADNADCKVMFNPPKRFKEQIKLEVCFKDVVSTCGNVKEDQFAAFNMTTEEVRNACESGFYSPLSLKIIYANIFCYMCNNDISLAPKIRCKPVHDRSGQITHTMALILHGDIVSSSDQSASSNIRQRPTACERVGSTLNRSNCQHVFCPTGQVYDEKGSCKFLFSYLNNVIVYIGIVLTAREPNSVLNLPISDEPSTWIRSPWSKSWKIQSIYLKRTNVFENVSFSDKIIVYLKHERDSMSATELYGAMTTAVKKPFRLCSKADKCVYFDQRFLDDDMTMVDGLFVPFWYWGLTALSSTPSWCSGLLETKQDRFEIVYPKTFFPITIPHNKIGRTFVCSQIEVNDTNYELLASSEILYYKPTNRVLFNRDFELFHDNNGYQKVRICLEDSGLERVVNNAKGLACTFESFCFLLVVVVSAAAKICIC